MFYSRKKKVAPAPIPDVSEDELVPDSDDEGLDWNDDEDYIPDSENEEDNAWSDSDAEDINLPSTSSGSTSVTSPDLQKKKNAASKTTTEKKNQSKSKRVNIELQWKHQDLPPTNDAPTQNLELKPEYLSEINARNPFWYFRLFFDDEVLEHITFQSNLYRQQNELSGSKKLKPLLLEELKLFIGIILYMGVVKMSSKRNYWAADTRQQVVADTLSRNRFEEILRILHFSDNNQSTKPGDEGYDKFQKIRPIIELIRKRCVKLAVPETIHSIDEAMVPFKGRAPRGTKVYMKNKPVKWGYKVWTRAGISGYVYDFELYGSLKGLPLGTVPNPRYALNESQCVVIRLTSELSAGHILAFDNYFASPDLLLHLKENNQRAVCTLRSNMTRNCPLLAEKDLKKKGRGAIDYREAEGVVVCKWYDNRSVLVASNFASVHPVEPCQRWDKNQDQIIAVKRPFLIRKYNETMGGVDKSDMLMAMNRCCLKSRKWYMRIIYYLIDLSVCNAWLLYKANGGTRSLTEFRTSIMATLLRRGEGIRQLRVNREVNNVPTDDEDVPEPPRKYTRIQVPASVRYDGLNHWSTNPKDQKYAVKCKREGCTRRTRFQCTKYLVFLCVMDDCFYEYHHLN